MKFRCFWGYLHIISCNGDYKMFKAAPSSSGQKGQLQHQQTPCRSITVTSYTPTYLTSVISHMPFVPHLLLVSVLVTLFNMFKCSFWCFSPNTLLNYIYLFTYFRGSKWIHLTRLKLCLRYVKAMIFVASVIVNSIYGFSEQPLCYDIHKTLYLALHFASQIWSKSGPFRPWGSS